MRYILWILLMPPALAVLFAAGIFFYAVYLQIRLPLQRFYETCSGQENFIVFERLPVPLIDYLVMIEDHSFFSHPGYSMQGIRKAYEINRASKKIITGESTITQQLVKNIYFGFKHSYLRKAVELVIALSAERKLGKIKILELYMNIIYFGNGVYGINDAAEFYFSKKVQDLSENQMFILACIPHAPTRGNPIQYPQAFETIRNRRLNSPVIKNGLSVQKREMFGSYPVDCLDPELRKQDDFTRQYPQEPPLYNERYGLYREKILKRSVEGKTKT